VANPQAVAGCQRLVTIDQTHFRINQHSRATICAAYQVGLASPRTQMLEDHGAPDCRCKWLHRSVAPQSWAGGSGALYGYLNINIATGGV
jgi:hypothetical protein